MAAVCRTLARSSRLVTNRVIYRLVMTSTWNLADAEEALKHNPYFDKYAEKIRRLQDENKDEYESRLKGTLAAVATAKKLSSAEEEQSGISGKRPMPKPRVSPVVGQRRRRRLADIMNVQMLEGKEPDEVAAIWREYYKDKEGIVYATLSLSEYNSLAAPWRTYPIFVVPLPRDDGFEYFLLQVESDSDSETISLHFTPLALYHKYGADSPEALSVSYFGSSELPKSAGQNLVLVLGEFDKTVLGPHEARCLLNTVSVFYNSNDPSRLDLVRKFNNSPDNFDHNELIREINCLSLQKQ